MNCSAKCQPDKTSGPAGDIAVAAADACFFGVLSAALLSRPACAYFHPPPSSSSNVAMAVQSRRATLVAMVLPQLLLLCLAASFNLGMASSSASSPSSRPSPGETTKGSSSGVPQKTWCVAKPSTEAAALQENIDFACNHVDCGVLRSGYPCATPMTLINHASVAMNIYYEAMGRNHWNCHFMNTGLIVQTDPSYGACIYQ